MKKKKIKFIANIVFFLDVILALLIIFLSGILIKTPFGTFSLFFGFAILFLTTVLKILRAW